MSTPARTAPASKADTADAVTPASAPAAAAPAPAAPRKPAFSVFAVIEALAIVAAFGVAATAAYNIRLYAVADYGRVIHEFDPWFNMRATQYLADNGAEKFFKWYDHESWYPLGRPVGTTIYPGMQFTAVAIWNVLKLKEWRTVLGLKVKMSLNDVCVFIPAWFGAIATIVLGLLTREVSGSWRAGAAAALVMSVIPAHIMRSVAGGFDNESVAVTAMCLTFWLWVRSLRTPGSWPIGLLAGLAYAYMVAAWGGFIFVGNMVAVHAASLVVLGYYSKSLWASYSLWYIVGTAGALQVPVVGLSPFKSMEQLALLGVFAVLQILALCDEIGRRRGLTWAANFSDMLRIRTTVAGIIGAAGVAVIAALYPTGYFGPLSVRVRSLFVKHTRTGNPLVDSVAEHQPASAQAYWQHLHYAYFVAPVGLALALVNGLTDDKRRYSGVQVSKWFIILYAAIAYYFSQRMSRLIILLGPVSSALGGIALGAFMGWAYDQVVMLISWATGTEEKPAAAAAAVAPAAAAAAEPPASGSKPVKGKKGKAAASASASSEAPSGLGAQFGVIYKAALKAYEHPVVRLLRVFVAGVLVLGVWRFGWEFEEYSDHFAHQVSQPSIKFKAKLQTGESVMVDDYQQAYWWIKQNTPPDSRVLSWWDYGYQIAGIANRTTLADGNTWNLEHIALIGRILVSPEKKAHALARHLADYVLVWAGNQGDDLAKSPHMARISASVYSDLCPGDPLCRGFGFYAQGKPSESMAASMLYKMHSQGKVPGVTLDPKLFEEVHTSKYGLVRVYKVLKVSQESREWLADPANRNCDAPGSWYCVGQYPPALEKYRPPKTHRHLNYDDNKFVEDQH